MSHTLMEKTQLKNGKTMFYYLSDAPKDKSFMRWNYLFKTEYQMLSSLETQHKMDLEKILDGYYCYNIDLDPYISSTIDRTNVKSLILISDEPHIKAGDVEGLQHINFGNYAIDDDEMKNRLIGKGIELKVIFKGKMRIFVILFWSLISVFTTINVILYFVCSLFGLENEYRFYLSLTTVILYVVFSVILLCIDWRLRFGLKLLVAKWWHDILRLLGLSNEKHYCSIDQYMKDSVFKTILKLFQCNR